MAASAPGLTSGPPPGIAVPGRTAPPGEAPPPPPAGLGANPPGLWQAPAASTAGASASAGEGPPPRLELTKDITSSIEAQVQKLLDQARVETEGKVKMELKTIRDSMMQLDAGLDQMMAQLDGMKAPEVEPMDAEAVGLLLSKIEEQWGQEIRTLKQELHQTILAHNHNADLIKHHKDTIDALRERCIKMKSNASKTEIQSSLQKLDARLKQQQKQRKLEPLFERLSALEQRVVAAAAQGFSAWRYPGVSPLAVPPGVSVPPGMAAGLLGMPGATPGLGMMPGAKKGSAAGADGTGVSSAGSLGAKSDKDDLAHDAASSDGGKGKKEASSGEEE